MRKGGRIVATGRSRGVLRQGRRAWRLVAVALELPGLSTLAGWAYALIARNRHHLPAPD